MKSSVSVLLINSCIAAVERLMVLLQDSKWIHWHPARAASQVSRHGHAFAGVNGRCRGTQPRSQEPRLLPHPGHKEIDGRRESDSAPGSRRTTWEHHWRYGVRHDRWRWRNATVLRTRTLHRLRECRLLSTHRRPTGPCFTYIHTSAAPSRLTRSILAHTALGSLVPNFRTELATH